MMKTKKVSSAESAGDENDDEQDRRPYRPREPSAPDKEQRQRDADSHSRDIHGESDAEAEVLTDDELTAADRLCEDGEDRSFLDLFRDESDSDEYRDECAEEQHRVQADVDDRPGLVSICQVAEQDRAGDDKKDEEDEVIEDAIAHSFAKRILSN
jgi:hypothetical protein